MPSGQRQLRGDAGFRADEPADTIDIGPLVVAYREGGVSGPDLRGIETLECDPGLPCDPLGRAEEVFAVMGFGGRRTADDDQPVLGQQFLACAELVLDLAPDLVGAPRECGVGRTFAAGYAGDPGLAMARAERVRRLEAVDAEHAGAALRELVGRGGAHGTEPEDDDVESFRHVPRHGLTL